MILTTFYRNSTKSLYGIMASYLFLTTIPASPFWSDGDKLKPLDQALQQSIAINLMHEKEHAFSYTEPWLNEQDLAWKELDMDIVAKKLDRTETVMGKALFQELLKPVTDRKELENRRTVLHKLYTDTELFESLTRMFSTYREREWIFIDLYNKDSVIEEYFYYYNVQDSLIGRHVPSFILQNYEMVKSILTTYTTYYVWMANIYADFGGLRALIGQIRQQNMRQGMRSAVPLLWRAPVFLSKVFLGMAVSSYMTGVAMRDITDIKPQELYALLVNVKQCINEIPVIARLPHECTAVHTSLQKWYDALDATSPSYDARLERLIDILNSSSFDSSSSNIALNVNGKMSLLKNAYNYFLQCKEHFVPLLHAYGAADAYCSVIKLYKEYEHRALPFSWVTFREESQPYYSFENLWNPLVSHEQTVANTLELGGKLDAHHMILTGPHGCGKTTIMKSIAYAYILGQSILLFPGTQGELVLIRRIGTYLNIKDALAKGMSSFMAEKQRMKELYKIAQGLADDEFCLFIIDEPYAKTLQVVGEARVHKFIQELYHLPQLMIILATHFAKPADLEQESQGCVKNYQPKLVETEDGTFIRTFEMMAGAAEWWFVDTDGKRTRFIRWLKKLQPIIEEPVPIFSPKN